MQFEQGQLGGVAASDSSDRSKDKTDQKVMVTFKSVHCFSGYIQRILINTIFIVFSDASPTCSKS